MIKIDDIIKRSRYINLSNKKQEYDKYHTKAKVLSESNVYRFDDKKFLLQHWESLDENQVECFKKCIDILDEAYENDNVKDFNYIKSYIINEVAPTVRDAKQTARYLKYKTTRMKNKIKEKIEKNVDDIKNAAGAVADKTVETNKKAVTDLKNNVKKSLGQKDIHEAYIQILDTMIKYTHCDRVLENNYNIQKRFNIMNMVENTDINNDPALLALVDSVCECVNTYDADFGTRLNTALETCFYFLSRKDKDFNKPLVLEEVVNNFISGNLSEENLLEMKSIIESSVVFGNDDKINVEFIYTSTPFDESTYDIKPSIENTEDKITGIIESDYFVMDFDPFSESFASTASKTVKDIVNDFKVAKMKKSTDVRTLVSKMFTKSPDQIIDGTPNFLSLLRLSYVMGAASVHPVLGGVVLLVDQFIAMKLKRRDVSKMITVFKNERQNVAEKLKKTLDEKDKRNLKEYDKYLKDGIEKLVDYKESLLSNHERDSEEFGEDYDRNKELDFLRDEEDNDVDFDYSLEATSFEKLFEKSDNFSKDYFTDNIKNTISMMNEDTIDTVVDVACKYPCIISTNRLYTILKEELDELKGSSSPKKWIRMSCLTSNMRKLDYTSEEYVVTSDDADEDVFSVITGLEDLFTEYSISKSLIPTNESMSTMVKSITNKLRKAVEKASDIDKEASRRIDSSVNMFLSGMQRAARNENREAIIKGSILPSASKVIKAAILDTGVALVNPALAIILAVGQFAVRKKMQRKERQLVLDEIDIELEMCKRYLRQAEDQNDLEAQKKILQIQRNLERQKQRIQYNMKIHWNQNVPDVKSNDD